MRNTDVVIIGAGQAGLAMSALLAGRGVEHVVLERRRIADRWLSERWESLRLLTPNWFARMPGWHYAGPEPDGFMSMAETAGYLSAYAASFGAPVVCGAEVESLAPVASGYRLGTTAGDWRARAVVIATGACDRPNVPACAARLSPRITQVASRDYRRPELLAPGGVLVVGASASGLQIARELAAAGRAVSLSVGHHNRVPRRWRGRDIIWLMERAGILDDSVADVADIDRTRHQPSLQLAGDDRPLDLGALRGAGVRIVGRLAEVDGAIVRLAGDLAETMHAADAKLARLIRRIDAAMTAAGIDGMLSPRAGVPPIAFGAGPLTLDLAAEGIFTVVWATGFRRAYPWLRLPVLGADGDIVQCGGVTAAPGIFTLGMPFQRRRKSTFIDGVGGDAEAILPAILHHLKARTSVAA